MTYPGDTSHLKMPVDATGIAHQIITRLPDLTSEQRNIIETVARAFAERDRVIEDFLNAHVVRAGIQYSALGDGSVHVGPAVTNVSPEVSVPITKAIARSRLLVMASLYGSFFNTDFPVGRALILRARTYDQTGTTVLAGMAIELTRAQFAQHATLEPVNLNGADFLEGLDHGKYVIKLAVQPETAAVTFVSSPNDTMSMTVIEVP